MSTVISNNFKKRFLAGKVKNIDTWSFTPVNSAFKNIFEHDDIKIEHYRTLYDLSNYSNIDYRMHGNYINYKWNKVYDDDDFSNKPMFITKAQSKRLKGQKGNWADFKKSEYWPSFSANADNLDLYLNSKQDGFYVIRSKDELSWFADRVNAENGNNEIIGVLGDAIEGTIDNTIGISENRPFNGILDGNGFSLIDIEMDCGQSDNGIVGILGRKGIVRNFRIDSKNEGQRFICNKKINLRYLTSDARDVNCGILVGRNYGTVENIDANNLGKIDFKAFVPEVYSVTNKSDDYEDFTAIRSKWSTNEDNFFFLNSWCINSPGNICPYVGYFAEGIYAERALMKLKSYFDLGQGSDGNITVPVIRCTCNTQDKVYGMKRKILWDSGKNEYVTSGFNTWLPPAVTDFANLDGGTSYNSNANLNILTKTFEDRNTDLDYSFTIRNQTVQSYMSGPSYTVPCDGKIFKPSGLNLTIFYDQYYNCLSDETFIKNEYGDIKTDTNAFTRLCKSVLMTNKPSAKLLFNYGVPVYGNYLQDELNTVWIKSEGELTVTNDGEHYQDKLRFIAGEPFWEIDSTAMPSYIDGSGNIVEYPVYTKICNGIEKKVISKTQLIDWLSKPGVIPVSNQGHSNVDNGFIYRRIDPRNSGTTDPSHHLCGYVLLPHEFANRVICPALNGTISDEQMSAIMELNKKLEFLKKNLLSRSFLNPNLKADEKFTNEANEIVNTWFDAKNNNEFWTIDSSNDSDKKIMDLITSASISGWTNINLYKFEELLQTKVESIISTNTVSLRLFSNYTTGDNENAEITKMLSGVNGLSSSLKFYNKFSTFPIKNFKIDSIDGNPTYLYWSFDLTGTVDTTLIYYFRMVGEIDQGALATNATYQGGVQLDYSTNQERYKSASEIFTSDISKIENKQKREEYLNSFVWITPAYDTKDIRIDRSVLDKTYYVSSLYLFNEFFRLENYQPIFINMHGDQARTRASIKFTVTYFDFLSFRHVSPRFVLTDPNDSVISINQQTPDHTLTYHGIQAFSTTTIPYYKELVKAPEYYDLDAQGIFTTDVNANLYPDTSTTDYEKFYGNETAIINYNNNIQLRSLSGINPENCSEYDYFKNYLSGDIDTENDHFQLSNGWPIYDISNERNGTNNDTFGRHKFTISNTLLNRSIRMHEIERTAYYVSPLVGANYGKISKVELSATFTNSTNFVGFIGGLAGKQERGIIEECSVNINDAFNYCGYDPKKYWAVRYKTTPFYPKKICDEIIGLKTEHDTCINTMIDVLFNDKYSNTIDNMSNAITDDVAFYYLKPIFNVGGCFGKIVPTLAEYYTKDASMYDGCKINNVSVNYNHVGNKNKIEFTTLTDNYKNVTKQEYLSNGEDVHNNYGSIAGLIEVETNNIGGGIIQKNNKIGIIISDSYVNGDSIVRNDDGEIYSRLLPFGRLHYIPNEINSVMATNMSPRDENNSWAGPQLYTTWTLDHPIITNQTKDDKITYPGSNSNFGGIINQSPNCVVGADYEYNYGVGNYYYIPTGRGDSLRKLDKYNDEYDFTYTRDVLQFLISASKNKFNTSATTRSNIGVSQKNILTYNIKSNFTPAFEILTDAQNDPCKHINPAFGSYVNYSRTGVSETINYLGPTKVIDGTTVLTHDNVFKDVSIIDTIEPIERLEKREIFSDDKKRDKYFYYNYDAYQGSNVEPLKYDVKFTTATSTNKNTQTLGYVFKDFVAQSGDGLIYKNNFLHLGNSVSNKQIRENLTTADSFISQGVSSTNGFGGILVTDSNDNIVMFIDNENNIELTGNSWNYETPLVTTENSGNCGMLIEVK